MKFDCGCEFEKLDFDNINLECPAAWDLIGEGLTKGLFQIEGSLGRGFCKKIQPRSIEELSDVISLIRPGCLETEYREDPETGKMLSIIETYIKTKRGDFQAEYIDAVFEPIFSSTYGVPVYQEQLMCICTDFAGFSLQEADDARKAVGKKLEHMMDALKDSFIAGSIKMGHSEEMAEQVFGWIDKFTGYGFNKSHGVSYALLGYWGAYAKVHFPVEFFKNKLACSDSSPDQGEEIKELIHEARFFDIIVHPPSLKEMNGEFKFCGDEVIFGLHHIKGVGKAALVNIKKLKGIDSEEALFKALFVEDKKVKKNIIEALIKSGAFSDTIPMDRHKMLARYSFMQILTSRERSALFDAKKVNEDVAVKDMIEFLIEENIPHANRVQTIKEKWGEIKKALSGNKKRMALAWEKYHLGMPLTGSEVDLYKNYRVDTTCRDFMSLANKSKVAMGVIIEDIRNIKDKNKNPMCFMKISDATYMLDGIVVFASKYNKFAWILEKGNAVLIKGKKDNASLLVDSIEHL